MISLRFYLVLAVWFSVGNSWAGGMLGWTNNLLTWRDSRLPGGPGGQLEIWYLEAFLRPGAHDREWGQTTLRHRTELLTATPDGSELRFRTRLEPAVEVLHEVVVTKDGLELRFLLTNSGTNAVPIQWFQPACIRLAPFTGAGQSNYIGRSFVYTAQGQTRLDQIRRTEAARYQGGQVYLPPWTAAADANPRPISPDRLTNGLIGCVSGDGRWILATASDRTHELFEGVYVCLHSDPLIGGLNPGESKRIRQKIYLLPNDSDALVRRYQLDFPEGSRTQF